MENMSSRNEGCIEHAHYPDGTLDAIEHIRCIDTKLIDKLIKVNREIFILSVLFDGSMCGCDLIKEIFIRSNILLSQASVYPVLYSLEEEGILHAAHIKGDMRTKRYSFTPKGKEIAQEKIEEFTRTMEMVLALIKKLSRASRK